jgi:hypothetical protein
MQLTLEIPDAIAGKLGDSPERVSRKFLEHYALNGYRTGELSHNMVRGLLGFTSWFETEDFLRSNGVPLNYTIEDLEKDRATLDRILTERPGSASPG